ncbi:hypothetical protein B9Z55_022953 [Caenorhabditis nigoni]|nr:hypothetical protein B9Z55_022953 [Caenorhabditis nigoni]
MQISVRPQRIHIGISYIHQPRYVSNCDDHYSFSQLERKLPLLFSPDRMRILGVWAFTALFVVASGRRRIYTEEDEAKYLQQLKQQELRNFEMEMKQQAEQRGVKYSSSLLGVQLDGGSSENDELPSELRGPVVPWSRKNQRTPAKEQTQALALRSQPFTEISSRRNDDDTDGFDDDDHWCYYCATPIDKVKPEMRRSIRNLLEMRRTSFPVDAVTTDCHSARNKTKLKKQKCTYKYCQTLSILDRNAGNSFVVRGCAEHFGAINVPELEKKNDHSCEMLHEKLEIKECICKNDKYCNAGWGKRSTNGVFQQCHLAFITLFTLFSLIL